MKRRLIILCLGLLLALPGARAQFYSSTNKKAIRQYELGLQQLQSANIQEAEKCLRQTIALDRKFEEAYLTLGEMLLDQRRETEAREIFEQFLSLGSRYKAWNQEARFAIDCIDFRREALAHPVPFQPINMGPEVNSPYDEYLPALTADGKTLIITRRMPKNEYSTAETEEEEDFYVSQLQEDGTWSPAQRMEEPVNSTDNEGAQCISQDGRIMIFTACNRKDGYGRCDLYLCVRHGEEWSRPRNIGIEINSRSWDSQPCLSLDGRTLYFVSDRKGGYGGKDIWVSRLTENGWGAPQNMGPEINTEGDESSPFIHFDDKTFYFTSNGHVGMGGFDLFVSRRNEDGTWGKAQNMGYPINTEHDESNLIVSADGSRAYFSSDILEGYGRQDLYYFDLPVELRPEPVEYRDELAQEETPEVGESITLKNVLFATGQYTLNETAQVELDKVVEMLNRNATMKIELEGHTDNTGDAAANQQLSEHRAKACYDYIVSRGIAEERLSFRGYGESRPIADNTTEDGRAQNRRTVFTVKAR